MAARGAGIVGRTAAPTLVFCLKNRAFSSVILNASRQEQLKETLNATDLQGSLDEKIMDVIESVLRNKPVDPQGMSLALYCSWMQVRL